MKTTVVIGNSGLLGKYFVNNAYKNRKIFSFSRTKSYNPNETWIKTDLNESSSIETKLKEVGAIDEIVYLAQSPNYKNFPSSAKEILNINFLRFQEVLEYSRTNDVKHVIYTSTGGIYGKSYNAPFSEEEWLAERDGNWNQLEGGLSFYFKSKIFSEMISKSYESFFKITVLRPFFIYGMGDPKDSLIKRLIHSVKYNVPIQVHGNTGFNMTPIHAQDASDAILHCLDRSLNGTYNLSGLEEISIRHLCDIIGNILNIKPRFEEIDGSKPFKICANINKLMRTGWKPNIDFYRGIHDIIKAEYINNNQQVIG